MSMSTGIPKKRRGFAIMSPEKQRAIAVMGGKAAHAKGAAHEGTRDEAREAGRAGGLTKQHNRRLQGKVVA